MVQGYGMTVCLDPCRTTKLRENTPKEIYEVIILPEENKVPASQKAWWPPNRWKADEENCSQHGSIWYYAIWYGKVSFLYRM